MSGFFETEIRPLLIERCVKCHGGSKQEGGLRLDHRDGLLAGVRVEGAFLGASEAAKPFAA